MKDGAPGDLTILLLFFAVGAYFGEMKVPLLLAVLLCSSIIYGQENTFDLDVLAYQWTTTHSTLTFSWPGHANTYCNGNSALNGYISSGGDISANGTAYTTCSTTYTPPSTQNIDIEKPVIFILAQSANSRMVLTCTRNVRWSQCHALNLGIFVARINKGHLEVQALSGRKVEWVRFDVVEQVAIVAPQPQVPTSVVAWQTSPFAQLDGNSAELISAANAGVLDAQMYLGYAYEVGKGVPKNLDTALVWFQRALDQHPDAAVTHREWIKEQIGAIQGQLAKEN